MKPYVENFLSQQGSFEAGTIQCSHRPNSMHYHMLSANPYNFLNALQAQKTFLL